MELNILRADPAGNITIFVLDQVEKAQRAAIAEKIMAIPALKAEQVGYVCPAEDDADGHMEMMGGEFCGNATRAYGMYIARQKGGLSSVKLRVSGCDHIVTAQVDLETGTARAEMPCPRSVQLVKVIDTNSLVWEGSCGSGSVACAVAQSEQMENGGFSCDYIQPAGVVRASVERQGGKVVAAHIGGKVTLDEPVRITL